MGTTAGTSGPDPLIHVVQSGELYEDMGGEPPTPQHLSTRIEELGQSIDWFQSRIAAHLRGLADESDERGWHLDAVELSVSIDVEAEAGVIFARAKSAAGFELKLAWKRSEAGTK